MDSDPLMSEPLAECSHICNITKPSFCKNFLYGLEHLKCNIEACVHDLCQEVLTCELNSDETRIEGYCPSIFDGWSCVNSTPSGSTAIFPCPSFTHLNFHQENSAYRKCGINGSWYDETMGKPFTHYINCPDNWAGQWYVYINKVYVSGYTISLAFLLLAIVIFLYFRSLRCVRNAIHTHLFVSSILHNLTWIVWNYAVVYRMPSLNNLSSGEEIGCKFLNALLNYFMVSTYMWMLCEGLYLFIVLIVTFVSESRVMLALYSIGWGLPAVLITIYAATRANMGEFDSIENPLNCWIDDGFYNWIYKIPCIGSIFLNVFFLVWIVYILVRKLHSDVSDRAAIVKTARAICVLIPLFGLHNFLSAFKPDDAKSGMRIAAELLQAVTVSYQGMVVAILFCLINNEVLVQLKKFCGDHLIDSSRNPQSMAMTQYTYVRGHSTAGSSPNPPPEENL